MKSLLVDALRRAQGEEPQEDTASRVAEPATGERPPEAETIELNLMQTDAFRRAKVGMEPGSDDTSGPPIEEASPPASFANSAATMGEAKAVTVEIRKPLPVRLGVLAPVLCLVAMAASAGGYLMINRLALTSLNDDLGDIASRSRVDVAENGSADSLQALPAGRPNVFDRAVLRDAGSRSTPARAGPVPGSDAVVAINSNPRAAGSEITAAGTTKHVPDGDILDAAFGNVRGGFVAYRAGDYGTAESLYREALVIEPNHQDALLGLAAVYQRTGKDRLALQTYEKLLSVNAGNAVAASAILAMRAAESGSQSESDIKHLLQRYPGADYLHFALGSVYVSKLRWPEARQSFQAASNIKPDDAEYRYNLAVSLERLGEVAAAREQYKLALAGSDRNVRIDRQALAAHIETLADEQS